jgi:hypothetical protein
MMTFIYSVLAIAAIMIPLILFLKWKNRFGKSDFDDIIFLDDMIYLFSNVYHSGGEGDSYTDCRICEIDRKTGTVLRRQIPKYFRKLKIIGEINGKIWLRDNLVTVFDTQAFEIVFMEKDIGEKLSELEDVKIQKLYLNEIDKTVFFLADNGYKYSIDTDSFAIERKDFNQEEQIVKKRGKIGGSSEFSVRKILDIERFEIYYGNQSITKDFSFIKPRFIRTTLTDEIVAFNDPESIAFIHYDNLNTLSPFKITMITKGGMILWTIPQDMIQVNHDTEYENEAELKFVDFQTPLLTLVFEAKRDKIVCIDVVKGKVVWNLSM